MGNPFGLVFIINGLKTSHERVLVFKWCSMLFMGKEKAPFQSQFLTLWHN